MTISYNWLCTYLPLGRGLDAALVTPEKLSRILTSLGLEVEGLEPYESVPGSLAGLVIGAVTTCERHPDADKLSITTVDIGNGEPLQIVCGAPNVAAGQKVVVATVGSTIYPKTGEPITMKRAKIRGVESMGMICAEDEIGLGSSHAGIMVLPETAQVGQPAATFFNLYTDWVYEIGLTPNRSDAMSHLGVANDVCAYLSHHYKLRLSPVSPLAQAKVAATTPSLPISITLENDHSCQRYSGICIDGVTVSDSPDWLKNNLLAIGMRPINNVVDITNFILHESGQPLHAFDYDRIGGAAIRVKNLPTDTPFTSLDGQERKLHTEDLMICDGNDKPMCIGGVFGGADSGITSTTTRIFLESAWFHPISIRRSALRHGLRTDAAARFEKGVDISQTRQVLKRAAALIAELTGGRIASEVTDLYPNPAEPKEIALKYRYLKTLSGKNYHPDAIKSILESLGFELKKEGHDDIWFKVPLRKTDVTLPADLVEEIMRIDGYDNIAIPAEVTMVPSADEQAAQAAWMQKAAGFLAGQGFQEIVTNSITNSAYYTEDVQAAGVKMLNNLSADLNMLRPAMLETGLEVVAHNLNRRNLDLRLFEFGKIYRKTSDGSTEERQHLLLLISGGQTPAGWQHKNQQADFYLLKGVVEQLATLMNIKGISSSSAKGDILGLEWRQGKQWLGNFGWVSPQKLQQFGIDQPVLAADIFWDAWWPMAERRNITYSEIPRFPSVERDLSLLLPTAVNYDAVQEVLGKARIPQLQSWQLFDLFESEKLGAGKKSMAIRLILQDADKTLTDKEVDGMTQKLLKALESQLGAVLR